MKSELVKNWFGAEFESLAPELRRLHINGGELEGNIQVSYGAGLAGLIGKRLAKKLGIPAPGKHHLRVTISHLEDKLHWQREFNSKDKMLSTFKPSGNANSGFWLEETGPIKMRLTVDVKDGGWYWRCLKLTMFNIPIPVWLVPKSKAYKRIHQGQYQFYVGFTLPMLGKLLSYEGLLDAKYND